MSKTIERITAERDHFRYTVVVERKRNIGSRSWTKTYHGLRHYKRWLAALALQGNPAYNEIRRFYTLR